MVFVSSRAVVVALVGAFLLLGGCATGGPSGAIGARVAPHYKVGNPYKIAGRWYHPAEDPDYDKVGIASWYGPNFHGKATANGEVFDQNSFTAAHTTLPMPSMVRVDNLENGRSIVVRVNDRGPFKKNRIIDLSRASATALGFKGNGLARVRVRYLGPASINPKTDDGSKVASLRSGAGEGDDPETIAAQTLAVMAGAAYK